AAQATDGASLSGGEQVAAEQHCDPKQRPDEKIDFRGAGERNRTDRQGRDAGQSAIAAKRVDVSKQEIDCDAPGNGAQRQEVTAQAQRCSTEDHRDKGCCHQRKQEADPGRAALHCRVPCAGVGADPDEGGLSERGQSGNTGEKDQAKRSKRIDADVIEQRDAEGTEYCGSDRQQDDRTACGSTGDPAHHARSSRSSSSISSAPLPVMSDCQIRMGISAPKTSTSLKALFQKAA